VNDWVAAEAIKTIAEAGLRVPQDLALVTYDDLGFFNPLKVTLTTMRQPAGKIGEQAVEILLQRIADNDGAKRQVVLPSELVIRESSGGPIGGYGSIKETRRGTI
jgi:LacI family transcriptional regulator